IAASQHPVMTRIAIGAMAVLASSLAAATAVVIASLMQQGDYSFGTLANLPDRIKVVAIFIAMLSALPSLAVWLLCTLLRQSGPWLYVFAGFLMAFIAQGYFGQIFDEVATAAQITGSARSAGTIGALIGLVFWAVIALMPRGEGGGAVAKGSK